MSKIVEFLHASNVFYLATVDGEKAQVRPINSVIDYNGKIYFETSNKKEMYQQMLKNPNVAVSGMSGSQWIRITGKAVMDERDEVKQAMFSEIPALKDVYSLEELEVYYIADMTATVYGFNVEPVILED